MKEIVWGQFFVLLFGTLFAWFNFGQELVNWINERACEVGCSVGVTNPFLKPCFWGATFFTIAFVLNILFLKRFNRAKKKS